MIKMLKSLYNLNTLDDSEQYLKSGITFERLDELVMRISVSSAPEPVTIEPEPKLEPAQIERIVDFNAGLMQRLKFWNRLELSTKIAK
jgi:hypothetical protein